MNRIDTLTPYQRLRRIERAAHARPILSISSRDTKDNLMFVIVEADKIAPTTVVSDWLNSVERGSWITPTVMVAGEAWRVNPRLKNGRWQYLFMRSV